MEVLVFFIMVLAVIAIAIKGLSFIKGNEHNSARHGVWPADHTDLTSSDPDYVTQAQFIHHQLGNEGSESGSSQSAYDSCAPTDSGQSYNQGDSGGGGYTDSGCSYDSGGSSSSDCGGGSYDSGGSSSSDCGGGS